MREGGAPPAALRALRSLPELVRWCDGHWWDAVRLLRGGELAAAITELGQFRQGRARRRGVELSPVLLAQVQQAAALPDENLALETVLRTLGAPPPRPRHNWRALERALGLGWLPDGRWLWPWWSGPGGLTFVVQNRGRGYLHGRIDALVPWLEVPQPEFGCLAGQQQRIPLHLTGRRRLAGLAPEILALHVD